MKVVNISVGADYRIADFLSILYLLREPQCQPLRPTDRQWRAPLSLRPTALVLPPAVPPPTIIFDVLRRLAGH